MSAPAPLLVAISDDLVLKVGTILVVNADVVCWTLDSRLRGRHLRSEYEDAHPVNEWAAAMASAAPEAADAYYSLRAAYRDALAQSERAEHDG